MGNGHTNLSALLSQEPLATLAAAGQPVFAVAANSGACIYANKAALALFEAADCAAMTGLFKSGGGQALRHLSRLSRQLRPGGPAQLQKLRFGGGTRGAAILTIRCWTVSDETDVFVAAALDAPERMRVLPDVNRDAAKTHIDMVTAPATDVPATDPLKTGGVKPAASQLTGNIRFLWRSDAEGRLKSIDGALCEAVGVEADDLIGKKFDALIDDLPLEPAGPLRAVLARRDTWSRIEVCWPIAGTNQCAPVTLGGLPSFDRAGRFDGFSGFGVIHLDDIADRKPPAVKTGGLLAASASTRNGTAQEKSAESPRADAAGAESSAAGSETAPAATPGEGAGKGTSAGTNVVPIRAWQRDTRSPRQSIISRVSGPAQTPEPAAKESATPPVQPDAARRAEPATSGAEAGQSGDTAREAAGAADAAVTVNAPRSGSEPAGDQPKTDADKKSGHGADDGFAASQDLSGSQDLTGSQNLKGETEILAGSSADNLAEKAGASSEDGARASTETPASQNSPDHGVIKPNEDEPVAAAHAAVPSHTVPSDDGDFDILDAEDLEAGAGIASAGGDDDDDVEDAVEESAAAPDAASAPSSLHFDVPKAGPDGSIELSETERNAFREIARALGARSGADVSKSEPPGPMRPAAIAAAIAAAGAGALAASGKSEPKIALGETQERDAKDVPAKVQDDKAVDDKAEKAIAPEAAEMADAPVAIAASPAVSQTANDIAGLLDRVGAGVAVLQNGAAVYANKPLLDTLGYGDFSTFLRAGGIEHTFKGRDPETLAREAAGGAIPAITRSGDVLAMDGRLHTAMWAGKPASLLVLEPSSALEREAKIRGLELDMRKRDAEVRELHSILDTATDGVVLLDDDARILSMNRAGQALFGYDQNEVAGEKFTVLLARESNAAALDYFDGLKSNGVRSLLNDGREVVGRARKGGAIPMFMTIGRVASAPEQRFCAVLRDVTQWKKAEFELSEARKEAERTSSLKSEFLAKISHEVRTPLNAILGFAEVIMDERFGPVGNERYRDYLKDIHSSGTHVLSLINDLLDLSKIEAGKLDLDFGSVVVSKVVNECVSIMQSQAIRERIIMRLSLAPRLPNVVADERSLRQIVLNILSNAVKFNEPGGQVIVSTALTDSGAAVIRIRDTGIG
ncbi:MAG: histidine kinase dimerization/phospho-acceptor domain-containing protein, partial [Beijerinckiaceae bacterium]